jgi:Fe-S-cluster containining protein
MTSLDNVINKENPKDIENLILEIMDGLLKEIHSPVPVNELWPSFTDREIFRDLVNHWLEWSADIRERRWETLCREMEKAAYGTRPYCLRCGECCRKGSPTLYDVDLKILRQGIIHRMDLMTLRAGEIGFSNTTDDLILLPEERVKVKEKPGTRECLFLDPGDHACRIYEDRPLQCQVMECWNPEGYQSLNAHSFLTRKDLLNPEDPLVPVIDNHAKRCDLSSLQEALSKIKLDVRVGQEEAMDILQYDLHVRELLKEKQGIDPEHQVFLLGRAVVDLLPSFGYGFKKKADGTTIIVPLELPNDPRSKA